MLDKYLIVDKIASGGMAEVFLARSTAAMGLGKFVAIKTILPKFSQQGDFLNMFRSEARIAMQLQHRNLVNIYDFGIDRDQCYLVMELIQGLTLSQILKTLNRQQKIIPISIALHIVIEATSGLHYAHEFTIHRDISPQNIMIAFQGDVKIIDFGVAKSNMEETQNGVFKGKIPYMSPEQIRGETLDKRSDIFSLGVVLYEILTNRRPFAGRTEKMFTQEMKPESITWIQEVNPAVDIELAVIIHKALNTQASERYSTMDEFGNELRQYMQNKYPQFVPSEVPKFMRREFESNLQALQEKLFGFQFGKKQKDDKTDTLPAVKVEKIKQALAEREAEILKQVPQWPQSSSLETPSKAKAATENPIALQAAVGKVAPPRAPSSNFKKNTDQIELVPETPLFTDTLFKKYATNEVPQAKADNVEESLELNNPDEIKKVRLVPKNEPLLIAKKDDSDRTSGSQLSSLSQVTKSKIIRKKFHIKYAYQANSDLSAIYEMQSLQGQTKRGSEC